MSSSDATVVYVITTLGPADDGGLVVNCILPRREHVRAPSAGDIWAAASGPFMETGRAGDRPSPYFRRSHR